MHALPAPALELADGAAGLLGLFAAAAALGGLVRLVFAVRVAVTAPQGGDALGVVAAELLLAARRGGALLLVAGVATVVVAVADEGRGYALPVAALKIFGGAGLGIYKTKRKNTQNNQIIVIYSFDCY